MDGPTESTEIAIIMWAILRGKLRDLIPSGGFEVATKKTNFLMAYAFNPPPINSVHLLHLMDFGGFGSFFLHKYSLRMQIQQDHHWEYPSNKPQYHQHKKKIFHATHALR